MHGIGGLASLHSVVAVCAAATMGFGVPAFAATGFRLPPDFGANDPRRVVAVGDSITEEVIGDGTCANSDCVADRPYPTVLQNLLGGTRPGITVINRGRGGEATDGDLAQLGAVLASDHPGFVLIMEGTNDATFRVPVDTIVGNLQAMVRLTRAGSAIHILGSIVPNFRDDGATGAELASFFAFIPQFSGGVFVACDGLDGPNSTTVIVGAGRGGGPHVSTFRYAPGRPGNIALFGVNFFAYAPAFAGGVAVAVADLVGDHRAAIITGAGPGGGPHAHIFRRQPNGKLTERAGFFAYDPAFRGGVAVGSVRSQVVTGAGPGGGPHVRTFTGDGVPAGTSLFAYPF